MISQMAMPGDLPLSHRSRLTQTMAEMVILAQVIKATINQMAMLVEEKDQKILVTLLVVTLLVVTLLAVTLLAVTLLVAIQLVVTQLVTALQVAVLAEQMDQLEKTPIPILKLKLRQRLKQSSLLLRKRKKKRPSLRPAFFL